MAPKKPKQPTPSTFTTDTEVQWELERARQRGQLAEPSIPAAAEPTEAIDPVLLRFMTDGTLLPEDPPATPEPAPSPPLKRRPK